MATWYTPEEVPSEWLGAPTGDTLQLLLDVSQAEIVAYAPALPEPDEDTPDDIPDGYRWAHLAHARNIWNAQNASPSGGIGADGESFALTFHPLDWAIKARLRPKRIFGGCVG